MKKLLLASLYLFGVILSGCSSTNNVLDGEKPPEVMVKVGNDTYQTILGTYCWGGDCVDTAGPEEILKDEEPIRVKPGEKIKLVMEYKPKPTTFQVFTYHESQHSGVDVSDYAITAPNQEGIFYYSCDARWEDKNKKNVIHGDASYNFSIEVE